MTPENRRFQLKRLREEGKEQPEEELKTEKEMFESADRRADECFRERNRVYRLLFRRGR